MVVDFMAPVGWLHYVPNAWFYATDYLVFCHPTLYLKTFDGAPETALIYAVVGMLRHVHKTTP